ncbi:hypothetical protein AUI06_06310 [archaeon 13_2_20CM_2_52_21]|nr:MAG: hypothetical protein AUI06_06310 [archaeon 13_2_20CM_2_52_21]
MQSRPFRKEWTRPLASQVASFLKELHKVKLEGNRFRDLPSYSPEEWVRSIGLQDRRVQKNCLPFVGL